MGVYQFHTIALPKLTLHSIWSLHFAAFGRIIPPQVARDAMAEWQVERTLLAVEHSCAQDWSGTLETLMADTGALIESAMTISDADAATLARVCA